MLKDIIVCLGKKQNKQTNKKQTKKKKRLNGDGWLT